MVDNKIKKGVNSYKRNQLLFVWGWLAVPIISWALFYWYVNFSSFVGAFQDYNGNWSIANFESVWQSIFNPPPELGRDSLSVAFSNTLKYFIVDIFVKYPIQLFVCYFLYKQIWGYKFYRYVFYLPAIISGVALIGVYKAVIAPSGPLAEILVKFGIELPELLASPKTATGAVMGYVIWTCACGHMLLLCGAMNRIPIEVMEAARLDGIGPLREFFNIILPLIWPTLSTLLILTCTGFLNSSGPLLLFGVDSYTMGTTTISYWIFEKVYMNGTLNDTNYNLVSAAGLMLTLVALPIILAIRKLLDFVPSVEY
jgi:ABC-type sugar transport system permease subunit